MTSDERIARLETKVDLWMESTTEYRKSLCSKLDKIQGKIDCLPCPQRIEQSKNVSFQLKALWAVTGGMVLAILSEWVKLR